MPNIKERYQNPTTGDTVNLRLFTYNSNNLANVVGVNKVDIYAIEGDDRRLVETITNVAQVDVGNYLIQTTLSEPQYCIGKYMDVWSLQFDNIDCPTTVENPFQVYPDLWYTTPIPIVYDFTFTFRPNRLRKGSKRYLIIEVTPNVPRGTDLARYYENLAIVADLKISISQKCGDCVPCEEDLRLIVDNQLVDYREKRFGYWQINTEDFDCGIYDVWFTLNFGENVYVTEKMSLQIY